MAAALLIGMVGTPAVAHAQVTKRIAVLMFKPRNYGTQWITPDGVRKVVWTSTNSAKAFYQEESFGKLNLQGNLRIDGDVFGWYTVPYDNNGTCIRNEWVTYAKKLATAQGYVDWKYDAVIYVSAATGCPGRAFTGGRTITVLNGFNMATVAHELGHAFGLAHASAWRCEDESGAVVAVSSDCKTLEYGDFSVMGATTDYHMNNFHKGALGLFAASNTQTVTASGIYALYPVEQKSTLTQVLRIPRVYDSYGKPFDYYYLELRQPYGFDDFAEGSARITGIGVRVSRDYLYSGSRTYLIDTTPETTSFTDAQLGVGKTFTDPNRRVSVTLVSLADGVAHVYVNFF